jgi:hypothetical protein
MPPADAPGRLRRRSYTARPTDHDARPGQWPAVVEPGYFTVMSLIDALGASPEDLRA